jgi:hypothetical protein
MVAVITASLAAVSPAQAAPTVSGQIARAKGYTLLAMRQDGKTTVVRLSARGKFKLRAQRDVTLQLLRPSNRFFGPIVLAHAKGRAYEAISGRNVNLGKIRLRGDYAAPAKSLGSSLVDTRVWARADRAGKPVGAGNLGLIPRARRARAIGAQAGQPGGGAPGANALPPGGDPTHVGIVTAFNADVTGAGIPNAENPQAAAQAGAGLFTEINLMMQRSVNADAAGVNPAQLSDVVRSDLRMNFFLDGHAAGGAQVNGVSVDCGALVYCRAGTGTGTTSGSGNTSGVALNTRWDGTVPANPNRPGVFSIQIAPNVGTADIHPADVFQVHYRTATGDIVQPTALTLYFLTVPALAAYDGGAGPQTVSYPVQQSAPGTGSNPIRMTSGKIRMTLWRPQRAALPGESGTFVDMGHLHYGVPIQSQGGMQEAGCTAQYYSELSPTLAPGQSSGDDAFSHLFPLHDSADDATANPANQLTFTLDLAACAAADGIDTSGPLILPLTAADEPRQGGVDRGVQMITVCLPGCDPNKGQQNGGPGPQAR